MLIAGCKLIRCLLLALGLATVILARADDALPAFALSGFGTLGATRTT